MSNKMSLNGANQSVHQEDASALLEAALRALDYANGPGLYEAEAPIEALPLEDWLDKGEWLSLAAQVGAERLFFIDNNPVVVFAQQSGPEMGEDEMRRYFNRVWCMSRPRLLFWRAMANLRFMIWGNGPSPTALILMVNNCWRQRELRRKSARSWQAMRARKS